LRIWSEWRERYVGAVFEEVVAFCSDLALLEPAAGAEDCGGDVVDGGLEERACGLGDAVDVLVGDPARAEDAAICEPLRGQVSDGQLREDDVCADGVDLLQLVVDDPPLGVDDGLEVVDVGDADLRVFLLALELELDLQDDDLGMGELLGLLLEAGVGEGLLEGHARHQEGVVDRSARDLLYADQLLVQQVAVQLLDRRHHDLREEGLVAREQLRVEGGLCALQQHLSALFGRGVDGDDQAFQSFEAVFERPLVSPDHDLRVHAVLDEPLRVLEQFAREDGHGGGSECCLAYPSPTSLSWLLAISTRILAAACSMSSSLRMVAPSLEMVVSLWVVIILSMPLGP